MALAPERLAAEIADLRRRLMAVERGGQLSRSTVTVDGEAVRVPDAVAAGATAGREIPGLKDDLEANARELEALDAALAIGLGELDGDLEAARDAIEKATDDAADAILEAEKLRRRITDEVLPAIDDAAASPVTDARLAAGSLTVWPFKPQTIPAGAIAPGAVGANEIADFSIAVKKLKSDRHQLY